MSEHVASALSPLDRMAFQHAQAVEAALADWNIYPRYGTEIEWVPLGADGKPLRLGNAQVKEIEAAVAQSPYVEGLAKEGWASINPLAKIQQLEFAIGQGKGRLKPLLMPDKRLAGSTIALATDSLKRNIRKQCRKYGIANVSFQPVPNPASNMTSAYHTNMSLWNAQGENLFSKPAADLYRHCIDEVLRTQAEGALLMLPTSEGFARIGRNSMTPSRIMHTYGKAWNPFTYGTGSVTSRYYDPLTGPLVNLAADYTPMPEWLLRDLSQRSSEHNRIETRLANADANPFLLAAADEASLLEAVKKNVTQTRQGLQILPHSGKHSSFSLPKTWEEAVGTFKSSTRMKNLLGDEIHAALLDLHLGKAVSRIRL